MFVRDFLLKSYEKTAAFLILFTMASRLSSLLYEDFTLQNLRARFSIYTTVLQTYAKIVQSLQTI